jgi:cation diffusion facilitator CzcD-associated flavoprotein CzcO
VKEHAANRSGRNDDAADGPPAARPGAIIGSGFAGLAMADQLKRRGIDDFVVLRVLRSSAFYPALSGEHVELITEAIREVRERSVVTADGTERSVDVLVFGTGFRAAEMPMAQRIRGRDGRLLAHDWRRAGAQAYLGTTVAGFPNLFLLTGPNSALAHNSVLLGIESQVRYVLDALRVMQADQAATVEIQPQVQQTFVRQVQARMARTVWVQGGCHSWFLDDTGRNTTVWPWPAARLSRSTRRFDLENYLTHRGVPELHSSRRVGR